MWQKDNLIVSISEEVKSIAQHYLPSLGCLSGMMGNLFLILSRKAEDWNNLQAENVLDQGFLQDGAHGKMK